MTDPTHNRTRSAPGHLTLTVGQDRGDLQGSDDRVLQAGADYLHRLGGGVLHVLPGVYEMHNALYLYSGLTLRGSGDNTVLRKAPSACSPLVADRRLLRNSWLEDKATATTLFPLLTAREGVRGATVENLVLDGNANNNEEINGNYSGAVFLQECDAFTFLRVTARKYNGDGYSFQVCDDVRFQACRAEDNANLGFHPGSGSQRPLFRQCVSRGNAQGIFYCWGVTDGLVDDCECRDNRDYGISIGHRDTDNRIAHTRLTGNHKVGLLFREQTGFRGPHRNLVEHCVFQDNGLAENGVGLDVRGLANVVEL